jgi:hypothetical protein
LAAVHVRRALLLFAIVIGLAALAASLTRSGTDDRADEPSATAPGQSTAPTAAPQPAGGNAETTLRFDAAEDDTLTLEPGQAAQVEVAVDEPGQVAIPSLGLSEPAQPLTPARFDVLIRTSGSHVLEFTPAGSAEVGLAGTLLVSAAER